MQFVGQFDTAEFQFAAGCVIAGQGQEHANFYSAGSCRRFFLVRLFLVSAAATCNPAQGYCGS